MSKSYVVLVFDRDNRVVLTRPIEADDEVSADAKAYDICFSTDTGSSYDVKE